MHMKEILARRPGVLSLLGMNFPPQPSRLKGNELNGGPDKVIQQRKCPRIRLVSLLLECQEQAALGLPFCSQTAESLLLLLQSLENRSSWLPKGFPSPSNTQKAPYPRRTGTRTNSGIALLMLLPLICRRATRVVDPWNLTPGHGWWTNVMASGSSSRREGWATSRREPIDPWRAIPLNGSTMIQRWAHSLMMN